MRTARDDSAPAAFLDAYARWASRNAFWPWGAWESLPARASAWSAGGLCL